MKKEVLLMHILIVSAALLACAQDRSPNEIREYEGKRLSAFDRKYDNSIKSPQKVNIDTYRLEITGLVDTPMALTYKEVLALPNVKRAITLYCVEGWSEDLLFEGVRLSDILAKAKPKPTMQTVIFHVVDGYTSSLASAYVKEKDLLLAYKINGRVLDERRGFPFQVVAESKLGYKWLKWVKKIELSDKPYKGYWEQRGYDNEADVNK
jgi:DMSO/TMAO reductase YedYZ molybdopterin-dependent catalytic subunit